MGLLDFIFGDDEQVRVLTATPGKYQEAAQHFALGLAQRNAVRSEELYSRYANIYAPYEDSVMQANQKLVQPSADLALMSIEQQMRLLPATTDFTLANIQSEMRLMPFREDSTRESLKLTTQQAQERQTELTQTAGLKDTFYKEAGIGAEALGNRNAGYAAAGVEGAYKGAEEDIRRQFSQFGIDPSSGSFKSAVQKVILNKARAKSGATTAARVQAEQESFNRLTTGMNVRQGAFAQPGTPGGAVPNIPLQNVGVPSGPAVTSPLAGSASYGGIGASGVNALSAINRGSTQTTPGDNNLATGLGVAAGYWLQ